MRPTLRSPSLRAALSLAALSAWLLLLFVGGPGPAGAAAIHLLLVAGVALFPWRGLLGRVPEEGVERRGGEG